MDQLIDDLPCSASLNEPYTVKIIMRDGFGQTNDDWHATVTRRSDGKQIVLISGWLWLLKRRVRRSKLDRAFARVDRRDANLGRVREFTA